LQKFQQNKICQDVTHWFVRELVKLATVNVEGKGKEEKWSY
jgi:hypothetical protein